MRIKKSQELRMLSTITLNCRATKIVIVFVFVFFFVFVSFFDIVFSVLVLEISICFKLKFDLSTFGT